MTSSEHERAIDLIIRRGVEGLTSAEAAWLESHLAQCGECTEYSVLTEGVGRVLQSVAVAASPALVAATQGRLRDRATQLQEQRSRNVLIALSFCIGAMSSMLSAWLWWRFGGFVAQWLALPASIVQPGIFVAWMLPAVIIAVAMLASAHPVIDRSVTLAILGEAREGDRR